jgi:hypothetical protein
MGMDGNPYLQQINENATLLVRVGADVYIRGWDRPELEVLSDRDHLFSMDSDGKLARLVAKSDLYVSVPFAIPVRIEQVGGDALVSGVSSRLEIQKVGGDLMVEKCSQVDIGMTGGDLTIAEISGPLNIQKVGGDLDGAELAGGVAAETIGGDASIKIIHGGLRLRTGGDVSLALAESGSDEIVVKAGGDVSL